MEDKRLDFDAPLLSVRRFTAVTRAETAPVAPGVVPFLWEQTPGHPKDSAGSVSLAPPGRPLVPSMPPPGRLLNEDGDEASSDGISSIESFLMNCSTSGSSDAMEGSAIFSMDPEVQDFMMSRFLPAAQAMATGLPTAPTWPAEKTNEGNGLRLPPLSHRLNFLVPHYIREEDSNCSYDDEKEDSEKECDDAGHLSSKSCGLVSQFCSKGSFCLLNPVPGMKIQRGPQSGRNLTPHIGNSLHGTLVEAEDENSWEAVYKHKLQLENHSLVKERSKLTSESNQLTYWSDSQTHDGSSSFHRSTGGVTSPFRNVTSRPPSLDEKGFLGVQKKDSESFKTDAFGSIEKDGRSYWVVMPRGGRRHGSGFTTPAIDRPLYADSVHMLETLNSKSSTIDATADTDGMDFADKDSKAIVNRMRMEQNLVLDPCEADAVRCKSSEVVDSGLSAFSKILNHDQMNDSDFVKHGSIDYSLPFEVNDQEKNDSSLALSLLPPPLPKSPSESWLSRTLPSVSSKNSSPQSLLAIQFQPRKQSFRALPTDPKQQNNVNLPK